MLEYNEILRQSKLNHERTSSMNVKRTCVAVTLHQDIYGNKFPLLIYWKNGRVYKIDKIHDVYNIDSMKNGKQKMYGIEINGHFTNIYEDGNKWYVNKI